MNHTAHEGVRVAAGRSNAKGGKHSSLLLQESLKKVAWFEERSSFSMFHPGKPFSLRQVGGKDMVDRWVDEKQGSGQ